MKNKELDGTSILFLILGIIIVIFGNDTQISNVGWILIMVGLVKQLLEWNK